MQLYRYFLSQSSEFCRHNTLWRFSTSNSKGKRIFRYRLGPEAFGYTFIYTVAITITAATVSAEIGRPCPERRHPPPPISQCYLSPE
jgi:hypothetical protein